MAAPFELSDTGEFDGIRGDFWLHQDAIILNRPVQDAGEGHQAYRARVILGNVSGGQGGQLGHGARDALLRREWD